MGHDTDGSNLAHGHSISTAGDSADAPSIVEPVLQCTQAEVWPKIWKHNVAIAKAVMNDGFLRCSKYIR